MAYRRNPFEDEEDDKFEDISDDPELARIKQEKELYQQRMIDSSYRSLQLVQESQGIASETGEELQKQREQLQRTERNLQKMNADLKQTDRNITSLKSIWGTVSTWFKKPLKQEEVGESSSSKETIGNSKLSGDLQQNNSEIKSNLKAIDRKTDLSWDDGGYGSSDVRQRSSADDIVDKNLDNILAGLTILKDQGMSLGNEIDSQNVMLDRLHEQTVRNEGVIGGQNLRIRKILK